jgi:hypothetical protein
MEKINLDIFDDNSKRKKLNIWQSHQVSIIPNHSTETQMILHTALSIDSAMHNSSRNHPDILDPRIVNGFSGVNFRHFMNNVASFPGVNYLEIGTYCGSTLLSALYNNLDTISSVYAMDDWSEFNDHVNPKKVFRNNLEKYISNADEKLFFYETDCFSFDKSKIKHKINLYFYDGAHSEQDQEMAFTYFDEVLDDTFIVVVDDWEQGEVRKGTLSAFEKLDYNVLASWQIVPVARENKTANPNWFWWLGAFVAVVKKTKVNK